MGTLRELGSSDCNVHLIFSPASIAEMFVYDTLKETCKASLDSVITVSSKSEFKSMLELVNMDSMLADRWLVVLDYSKLKSQCNTLKGLFDLDTTIFMVKVANYKDYKEFKELIKTCNDLYLSILRYADISFLLGEYISNGKVLDFVAKSYARDPEKIFELRQKLKEGTKVENPKDVTKLIGESASSLAQFAFLLLADPPTTARGYSMVYRKRIQMADSLIETFGVGKFKNFLTATVKDILDIKVLYLQGKLYRSIRDLPEGFDEKRLSRYNWSLTRITDEIPYNRLVKLYWLLKDSGYWRSKKDLLDFIYKYYGGL